MPLTLEERTRELERMQKCLQFSAGVFTRLTEHEGVIPAKDGLLLSISERDLKEELDKQKLLCADFRRERLLLELAETLREFGPTSCGVWDFAHSTHHVIFDEDLKRRMN